MSVGSPDNEERRLLAEYETATAFYCWAVRELSSHRATLARDEYDKLGTMVENARLDCGKALLALKTFKAENSK